MQHLLLLLAVPALFAADSGEIFETRVRPVLVRSCFGCHTDARSGGLRLDSRASILSGGRSGPALVPGKPDESLMVQVTSHTHPRLKMPPSGKLSDSEIAGIREWVASGAAWPEAPTAAAKGRNHWAYQPVRDTPRGTIDHFIVAKMQERKLRPAHPADRRTLIRRATYDLTGLPPSPAEVEAFVADRSPDAFAKVVDRLLASPHYGERWGKHWLDVVRYADTSGENSDYPVPQAYLYRDWVIAAFNRDLPYDRFLREQIAGDLIEGGSDEERWQRKIATGYLALSRQFSGEPNGNPYLAYADTVDNVGEAVLGLTVKCARCHNHKFDAIAHRDYFALYGIFESTRYPFAGGERYQMQGNMVYRLPKEQVDAAFKPFQPKLEELEMVTRFSNTLKTAMGPLTDEVNEQRRQVFLKMPRLEKIWAVTEGKPHDANLRKGGEANDLGEVVPRGFLSVLGGAQVKAGAASSGRLELAEWLTDRANPLTARVIVNRIWQHHFGAGLVATPNNFGVTGRPPTHPELLDWLTARFVESGWSIKKLHRLIMLSAVYQFSSSGPVENRQIDPERAYLWEFRRQRQDAEQIRDSLLLLSGKLDPTMGGPHPFPDEATWDYTIHQPFAAAEYPSNKRSVYLMLQRLRRHPYLVAFDGADPLVSTAERSTSSTPLQALYFMNNPFVRDCSLSLAAALIESATEPKRQVELAYLRIYGRPPDAEETQRALEFFDASARVDERKQNILASYLRGLLSTNEFIFID